MKWIGFSPTACTSTIPPQAYFPYTYFVRKQPSYSNLSKQYSEIKYRTSYSFPFHPKHPQPSRPLGDGYAWGYDEENKVCTAPDFNISITSMFRKSTRALIVLFCLSFYRHSRLLIELHASSQRDYLGLS